jgi:hypothetical protein
MRKRFFIQVRMLTGMLVLMAPLSCSISGSWQEEQIADAVRAAPHTVTHQAKIYAWQPFGQLVLVRDGPGPYTCVASGSVSLRFAKPPLPSHDPFCADPNAWTFIQAYWTEESPEPTEAIRPLPHAPGMVWMLAGRQGVTSHVAAGKDEPALEQIGHTGAAQGARTRAADSISLTPQLMILPLPLDPAASAFPGTVDLTHPLTLWMGARGTPIGYAPVPVPEPVHHVLRILPPDPIGLPRRD